MTYDDDDEDRLDTEASAEFITEESGVPTKPKTVQNWRNAGQFEPGDWEWFGRVATTTKGRLRRFIKKRQRAEPARRRNARDHEEPPVHMNNAQTKADRKGQLAETA